MSTQQSNRGGGGYMVELAPGGEKYIFFSTRVGEFSPLGGVV